MENPSDRMTPATPTTERALPPSGDTGQGARSGARAVPAPGRPGRPSRSEAAVEELSPRRVERPGVDRSAVGGNGKAGSPAAMRREIEATRARLSGTLDALEARIVYERESLERKKDELVDRATLKPLRRKLSTQPWRAVAIGLVAGYIAAALRD